MRLRRYGSILLLAACVAAALVMRRFVFLAWYPVVMSAATSAGFALSLFGEESLCYTLAKRIPPHILPSGAKESLVKFLIFSGRDRNRFPVDRSQRAT